MNYHQGKKTVRNYYRVSSNRQEREETIETQKFRGRNLVKEINGPDARPQKEYEDDGYSGDYLERPGLDQLRADLRDPSWNVLICYSADRLSRDFFDGLMLVDEILDAGKEIIYVDGPAPSPDSRLQTRITAAVADDEKQKILRKLYGGKLRRVEQNVINSSVAPYGYELVPKYGSASSATFVQTHYKINEEEAKVVRMIFSWVGDDRYSVYQVIKKLADLDIKPRKSPRAVWNTSTLYSLLKNETYIGKARFGSSKAIEPKRRLKNVKYRKVKKTSRIIRPKEEWKYTTVPAILEDEEGIALFERTQKQLTCNRRESAANKTPESYLFASRICCTCGYTRNGSGSANRKHIYYTCSSRKSCYPEKPCNKGGINARVADEYAWNKLIELSTDVIALKAAVNNYFDKEPTSTESADKQATTLIQTKLDRLSVALRKTEEAYHADVYSLTEFKSKMQEIKDAQTALQNRLQALTPKHDEITEVKPSDELLNKIVLYAPKALQKLTFAERREIVLDSVSKVTAIPGFLTMEGVFNVRKGIPIKDRKNLLLKGKKASISSLYYVDFKTISWNCRVT